MHIKDSDSEPSGYFIRSGVAEPERGPLTLENLQDLAEFENISPEWWVRTSEEENPRAFSEWPELMSAVFPDKKTFDFRHYEPTADPDVGHAVVDTKELYRCEADGAKEPVGEVERAADPVAFPAEAEIDVKAILQASEVMRAAKVKPKRGRERMPFSLGRVFRVVRWTCSMILFAVGIFFFESGGWVLAFPFFGLAVLLVALDLVGIVLDQFDQWIANAVPEPADFGRAEERLRLGDWSGAAAKFLAETREHPKELRGYFAGISAAHAAGDRRTTAAFHSLARANLAAHDLNLLNGALRRQKIPPVPNAK